MYIYKNTSNVTETYILPQRNFLDSYGKRETTNILASKDQTRSRGKKIFLRVWKGKIHLLQNAKNPTSNERRQQENMVRRG
ncbi:hypothetical protein Hanom_Chr12g01180501 [Helianthus anomalus]